MKFRPKQCPNCIYFMATNLLGRYVCEWDMQEFKFNNSTLNCCEHYSLNKRLPKVEVNADLADR